LPGNVTKCNGTLQQAANDCNAELLNPLDMAMTPCWGAVCGGRFCSWAFQSPQLC